MLAPSVGKYCIWRGPIVLESVFLLECVCIYETHFEPKSQVEGFGEQNVWNEKGQSKSVVLKEDD